MEEKTYNCETTNLAHIGNYNPVRTIDTFFYDWIPSYIATKILNIISGQKNTTTKWKNSKSICIRWSDNGIIKEKKLKYYQLVESLKKNRQYNSKELDLPSIPPSWIDKSIELCLPFYAPCNQDNTSLAMELGTSFGNSYPIKPNIDREGLMSGGLITLVERNLLLFRNELINNSKYIFNLDDGIWFGKLLCYLNMLVSSFDVTMITFYNKAKYDEVARKSFSWIFNEEKIGPSITSRITDKIKWVHAITGNLLPDISKEQNTFNRIRIVRNHLNHFDPPVFACTIEDNAEWINCIFDVAILLTKIREAISASISNSLIEILLQKPVMFEPYDPGKIRYPQTTSGYKSCFEYEEPVDKVTLRWNENE